MRPAICGVCQTTAVHSPKGEWVSFSDYKSLDNEEIGHPVGLEWICANHVEDAKLLTNKSASDALSELRKKYPATNEETSTTLKTTWWQRLLKR